MDYKTSPIALQFTDIGEYVGHYNCILEDQEEEEEPVRWPEISSLPYPLFQELRIPENVLANPSQQQSSHLHRTWHIWRTTPTKSTKWTKRRQKKKRKKKERRAAVSRQKPQSQRNSKNKDCGSEVGLRRDHSQPVTVTVMKSGPAYTAWSPGLTANLDKNGFPAIYARNGLIWIALRNHHILCVGTVNLRVIQFFSVPLKVMITCSSAVVNF